MGIQIELKCQFVPRHPVHDVVSYTLSNYYIIAVVHYTFSAHCVMYLVIHFEISTLCIHLTHYIMWLVTNFKLITLCG